MTSFFRRRSVLRSLWTASVWWSSAGIAIAATKEQSAHSGQKPHDIVPFLEGDPNLLFLGNSYTQLNNLPQILKSLLEAGVSEWDGRVKTKKYARAGTRLPAQVEELERINSPVKQWLTETRWKWVCLQDQSQVPGFHVVGHGPAKREFMASLEATQKLNEYIELNGAQTLLIMTWGRLNGDARNVELFPDFLTMQAFVTEGYRRYWEAATTEERPVYMAPAGLVFETIYNDIQETGQDPTVPGTLFYQLFDEDGGHPSYAGSYLVALTMYTTMTGKNPKEVTWFPSRLDKQVCLQIQDAVSRTILQTYASHTIEYPWQLPWPNSDLAVVEL